jgi:transcription elongation factor S-II
MYSMYGGVTKEYLAKKRTLQFNLKNPKHPELRLSVLQGMIDGRKLCNMSGNEMASPALKEEREKYKKYWLEASKFQQFNTTSTDMFKCGKCGGRETTYYQMQTRRYPYSPTPLPPYPPPPLLLFGSADEPMTTFHTCTRCGNRWKS